MICADCRHLPICKFYRKLKDLRDESEGILSLDAISCRHKAAGNSPEETKEGGAPVSEMMEKIFDLGLTQEEKESLTEPWTGEYVKCDECGKEVPEPDITEDIRTKKSLCPDCYDKTDTSPI